ncbi:hypothetical protein IW138_004125 [Coemansia sp. RSA 986]|nr:hypothetical protein LPJ74_003673 [Coemansia sp. RSA 1843]KAJ2088536.1 hypothetical protein IW138_004125 [Coemansia sp. RSA 986]
MGRLTNIVSSDISQIERGITNIIVCFTIPIQALASVAVLVYMLGPVTISGWALIVALVPVQMWASQYLAVLRAKAIKYTDKRIVATREALQGKLKYGPVFAVIGIFNSMSVPLSWLPGALTEARNSTVPFKRIKEVLLEEELDNKLLPQHGLGVALRIRNGRFAWKSPTSNYQFENDDTCTIPSARYADRSLQTYKFPQAPGCSEPHGTGTTFDTFYVGNIEIPHGSLVAVVGTVGSGKSSLLNALIGEMKIVSGSIALGGTLSYAPQIPWVMNASIRDNITFGLPFDKQKYINVVEACALEADLHAMPDRDLTEAGERGVTLSGGQKQRINIARAVYAERDMILLDDCLSAVDVKISHDIFRCCIKGILANRTRIMATNDLDLLSAADIVIAIGDGRVVEHGSFSQLMAIDGLTAEMCRSFASSMPERENRQSKDPCTEDSSFRTATPIRNMSFESVDSRISTNDKAKYQTEIFRVALPVDTESSRDSSSGRETAEHSETEECSSWICPKYMDEKAMADRAMNGLMSQEERVTGQVAIATYVNYIKASGGYILFAGIILSLVITQGCRVGSDFWMRAWVRHRKDVDKTHLYIGIYALFGAMQFVWFVFFAALLVVSAYKGSKRLHNQAMQRVLRAPMSFFDTTPLGRVLNRFTRDIDSLDFALCDFFRQFYQNISRSIGSFVSISILVPIFLAPLIPLFATSWILIYIYMRTSVEIQRVAAIARSPLYAHYAQTLQGLATIRAYKAQDRYISIADKALDSANRPQWLAMVAQNWVWLRVDLLSHLLSFVVCIVVVAQPLKWDTAAVGLLLIQATQMGAYATYAGRGWTELQNNMNSVERIEHYATSLEQEEASQKPNRAACTGKGRMIPISNTPRHWPRRGTVIIRELTMCYRQGLPPALKNINMEIYDGDRVAIIGRSGAGKSSIISALFRISEPSCGRIFIDGIDIQTLTLGKLRKSIGILPQDPVLFDGTLRDNLDPLHEFSDSDIWSVIDLVSLHSQVAQRAEKLDTLVGEGGDSFSVGQRQLICLARALLRKPRILILDEATANVDYETDATIQRIILSKENRMSVVSIAHRLQTIIRYDKVFVVDNGQIVESGSPLHLLERHLDYKACSTDNGPAASVSSQQRPSVFHDMIKEMGSDAVDRMLAQIRMSKASDLT